MNKDVKGSNPFAPRSHDRLYIKFVELLLRHGAKVDTRDGEGLTPLHAVDPVFLTENTAAAELLIAGGADVNAKDNIGQTPLHIAASLVQKGVYYFGL